MKAGESRGNDGEVRWSCWWLKSGLDVDWWTWNNVVNTQPGTFKHSETKLKSDWRMYNHWTLGDREGWTKQSPWEAGETLWWRRAPQYRLQECRCWSLLSTVSQHCLFPPPPSPPPRCYSTHHTSTSPTAKLLDMTRCLTTFSVTIILKQPHLDLASDERRTATLHISFFAIMCICIIESFLPKLFLPADIPKYITKQRICKVINL